jgi:hypothetical protein
MPFMRTTRKPAACVWHGARRIQPKRKKWPLIIEAELLERVRAAARAENKTMSWYVCDAITEHLLVAALHGPRRVTGPHRAVGTPVRRPR